MGWIAAYRVDIRYTRGELLALFTVAQDAEVGAGHWPVSCPHGGH
jgi:hypothetical protein